jgi:DNA-binding GntR family transcriptional regulator
MRDDALPARIAADITARIADGDMAAETHLTTPGLAERYAVSRSPVREALRLLEDQGLVRQERNRGYFVNTLTDKKKSAVLKAAVAIPDAPRAFYALAEDWVCDAVPEVVTEAFLIERYSLSRAELSVILTRATAEGWIARKAGYGWRLLPVAKTPEAQAQLYRMRMLLEPAAFLEPTFQLDRPMLARIRSDLERIRDSAHLSWPADRLHAAGVAFHEDLLRMSGNFFLLQAIQRVNRLRRLLEYRSMIDRDRVRHEASEHLDILDPIERGDLVEASFRMRAHLSRALERKRPSHLLPS